MIEEIFKDIFFTSVFGTALAALLLILRPLTRKFFESSWHYYMWLVVLVVMIFPVKFNFPEKHAEVPEVAVKIIEEETENYKLVQGDNIESAFLPEEKEKIEYFAPVKAFALNNIELFSYIWIFGAAAMLLIKLTGYIIFLKRIQKNSKPVHCPELSVFTDRKIKVKICKNISSPLMTGLLKPTLLLPETEMTPQQLNSVLCHEMVHFKRKDILYKWFLTLVKCIHWFNPAIYFIGTQISAECEISCDLAAVNKMDDTEKVGYMKTILFLLTNEKSKIIPFTTGMTGSKKLLKRRFIMIKNKHKINKKIMAFSIAAALLILFGSVFASGIINGRFEDAPKSGNLAVNTDEIKDGKFNFLLLGLDEANRLDAVMVFSANGEILSCISIPRDTSFGSGLDAKKLSSIINEEDGDQKVIDAVKEKLSIPVTYYAKIHLNAVKEAVDSVGGIEFDVPVDMAYDDPYKDLHINLKKGRQFLNGEQVCSLLQFRKNNDGTGYSDGDLSRIRVSQEFIKELFNQKFNKDNLDKAADIYKNLSGNIESNCSIADFSDIISVLNDTLDNGISFATVPGENVINDKYMFFYEIDDAKLNETFKELGFLTNK